MRRAIAQLAFLAGAVLVLASATPAYADPGNGNGNGNGNDPPGQGNGNGQANGNGGGNGNGAGQNGSPNGANGDVKVHDWPDHKNSSDNANDPKVCRFEIHGSKFDPAQAGMWWIQEHQWGNGDKTKAVLTGEYAADGNGDWTRGPYTLSDGHYKLFVEMRHSAGNSGNTVTTYKHKVFKVECPTQAGGGSPSGGEQGGQNQGQAVAGFEQAPQAGVSPIVGSPTAPMTFEQAVANQQAQAAAAAAAQAQLGAPAVAGVQTVPGGAGIAGAENAPMQPLELAALPSTSTAAGIPAIFGALGFFGFAFLLRKRL